MTPYRIYVVDLFVAAAGLSSIAYELQFDLTKYGLYGAGFLLASFGGGAVWLERRHCARSWLGLRALAAAIIVSIAYPIAYISAVELFGRWKTSISINVSSALGASCVALAVGILAGRWRLAYLLGIVAWGALWFYVTQPEGVKLFGGSTSPFQWPHAGGVFIWQGPIAALAALWLTSARAPDKNE